MSNTNTYNGIAMSISTMGYGANTRSRLFKLSVDGNTKFDIDANGNITASGNVVSNNQKVQAPTRTVYTSGSGTYTVPTGVKWLSIRMIAGGGGGGGGSTGQTNGTAGSNTTFGTSLVTCTGGGAGKASAAPDAGGIAIINSPASGFGIQGGTGGQNTGMGNMIGPTAGVGPFGGAGSTASINGAGQPGMPNSGAGGSGAGCGAAGGSSSGGSAGGYADVIISSPNATYAYSVGNGGNGGGGPIAGGAGGSGIIIIQEHYNY